MKKFLAATFVTVISCGCTPEQLAWFRDADTEDRHAVIRHVITESALEFGVDPRLMIRIAECESGLNPGAKNPKSTATGLFQFLHSTWESNRGRLEPVYEPWQIVDPIASSRIAADMVSQGSRAWASSESCWRDWENG